MKWIYSINDKVRTSILLAIVLGVVVLNGLWERHQMADMNKSCVTIFKDRLLPEVYIFHLTDFLYQKRLVLSGNLHADNQQQEALLRLKKYNNQIDSLVHNFENTYLVKDENVALMDFKTNLKVYNVLEKKAVMQHVGLFNAEMALSFEEVKKNLHSLSEIQIKVGEKEHQASLGVMSLSNLGAAIQTIVLIVIGILIQQLVWASKLTKKPRSGDFRWN